MATVRDLLQVLADFWTLLDKDDTDFVVGLWEGYEKAINDQYVRLYQLDQAKSIETIEATVRREWFHLDLSYLNATEDPLVFSIDDEIVSIPLLQDGINVVETTLEDGVDYTIDPQAHTIAFTSAQAETLVGRTLERFDSQGLATPTEDAIQAGYLSGLTSGVDYDLTAETLFLKTKSAFDVLAGYGDTQILKALEDFRLWAPELETDEELVFRNFGILLELSPSDIPVDIYTYTQVVKGLWYISWNQPSPTNLRNGLSLLFGYPTAPRAGVIQEVSSTEIMLLDDKGEFHTLNVSSPFVPIVSVGQSVRAFEALTDAVLITDERNTPNWWVDAIGLARYAIPTKDLTSLTPERSDELKALLRFSNFGIVLKDWEVYTDIEVRDQILKAASSFLSKIKPTTVQFAFLTTLDLSTTPDEAVGSDEDLSLTIVKKVHQTIRDNYVYQFFRDSYFDDSVFTDYDDYAATPNDAENNPAYYLDSDKATAFDELTLMVDYPGGPGYVAVTDAGYEAWRDGILADSDPPVLTLTPPAGVYHGEIQVVVAPNEPARILYTLDGANPQFSPQYGDQVSGPILMQEGINTLKVIAKDVAGNPTSIEEHVYYIYQTLPLTRALPSPSERPAGESINLMFGNQEPNIDVFYTLDGSDPTDIAFEDVARLNGLRIKWAAPTAIELENPNLLVGFLRGAASINLDGTRTYEIAVAPNTRYFVYAVRVRDNQWRVDFSRDNLVLLPNTDSRLLIGFVMSDSSREFSAEAITNAVDAGEVQQIVRDSGLPTERSDYSFTVINKGTRLPLPSGDDVDIRFFARSTFGQFDPTQRITYPFDVTDPTTIAKSSITNSPYSKTLRIELTANEAGSTIFYSSVTTAPVPLLFGFPDKLRTTVPAKQLEMLNTTPNKVSPSESVIDIVFKRIAFTGEETVLTTTEDLAAGMELDVPVISNSFFDVVVVPDFNTPTKWRLEIGDAGVPATEAIDRFLVARVWTNPDGILDIPNQKGLIQNAVKNADSAEGKRTHKYVEPINVDISVSPYQVILSFFAKDAAGNLEKVQSLNFSG